MNNNSWIKLKAKVLPAFNLTQVLISVQILSVLLLSSYPVRVKEKPEVKSAREVTCNRNPETRQSSPQSF